MELLLGYNGKHALLSHWTQHLNLPEALGDGCLLAGVSQALKSSGQINKRFENATLLQKAARLESWTFVEELLVCGANSNGDDEKRRRILHCAAEKGQLLVDRLRCWFKHPR